MSKLYTHAGVSIPKGKLYYVFRTANRLKRIRQLEQLGDINVDIVPLLEPLTKQGAAAYLYKINFHQGNQHKLRALRAGMNKSQGLRASYFQQDISTYPAYPEEVTE